MNFENEPKEPRADGDRGWVRRVWREEGDAFELDQGLEARLRVERHALSAYTARYVALALMIGLAAAKVFGWVNAAWPILFLAFVAIEAAQMMIVRRLFAGRWAPPWTDLRARPDEDDPNRARRPD